MKRYIVVTNADLEQLEIEVNNLLNVGYIPVGGVAVAPYTDVHNDSYGSVVTECTLEYVQAMTRINDMEHIAAITLNRKAA